MILAQFFEEDKWSKLWEKVNGDKYFDTKRVQFNSPFYQFSNNIKTDNIIGIYALTTT
jgi:hypothetical protein